MIKRTYFMSCQQHHEEGQAGFYYFCFTITIKSWFDNPRSALKEANKLAKENLNEKYPEYFQVMAFNRV